MKVSTAKKEQGCLGLKEILMDDERRKFFQDSRHSKK